MPSRDHEVLIELFRNRPSLAPELLHEALGVKIPAFTEARAESTDLTDCQPTEYRADAVISLTDGTRVMAVVVEIQRRRDPKKWLSWPVYLATLRARLGCPVSLLVICPDERVAAWCRTPIDMGHAGWILTPHVIGPSTVPVVTDPEEAVRDPELAVLSALAHHEDTRVLDAFERSLRSIEDDKLSFYTDFVIAALPDAARKYLEALMVAGTYEYQSDFVKKFISQGRDEGVAQGKAEGKVEGKAQDILMVLSTRSIPVSEETRERVGACTDVDQLDVWLRRAVTAESADDLFD